MDDTLPDYWEEYLPDKIARIKGLQDEGGKDCFSFVVMADMHYPANLGKRSPAVAKRILDKCDIRFVLALGDFQNRGIFYTKEDTDAEWGDIRTMLAPINENVLMQKGNHDGSWGTSNGTAYAYNFTPAELYNRIYALTYKHQNAVTDESGTAYYVDDTARKIRFIMLNTTCNLYEEEGGIAKYNNMTHARLTQVQFDFLTEKALATVPDDDWCVVLAGHHPLWEAELKDVNILLGVLNAYKTKGSYEGAYAGTASGGVTYTNLADPTSADWKVDHRISSTAITTSGGSGKTVCNPIPISPGDKIRIKGVSFAPSVDRYALLKGTDFGVADYISNITGTSGIIYTLTDGVHLFEISVGAQYTNFCVAFTTPTDPYSVIITKNEDIVEGGVSSYDAVSVNCNFANAKGNLVGYFSGHNHNDMTQVLSGIRQVITRCDANEENIDNDPETTEDDALHNERVAGTITEQSFDVFTVNKATRTIYATKIGAGADRTISY